MRRHCIAAVCVIAAFASTHLWAAGAERADLIGKVCGDATAMGEAGRSLTRIAADGSPDDRGWAALIARALIDRKLSCDATGAVMASAVGSLDASTGLQRNVGEGSRSPLLSLRNRALFETAEAALALRSAPDPARRSAALRTLERQASNLPEQLFDAAVRRWRRPRR